MSSKYCSKNKWEENVLKYGSWTTVNSFLALENKERNVLVYLLTYTLR